MSRLPVRLGAAVLAAALVAPLSAQVIQAPFNGFFSFTQLGSVPGVPTNYGGVTFLAGDPNTLLIGGSANRSAGAIYAVQVTRDTTGKITGFAGSATLFATAPNIDGGLAYGPGGVLFYTGYSTNELGQIKPGSTSPDKVIQLSPLGVASSVGSLAITPNGYPNPGHIRLLSYSASTWYDATLTPDGSGTYDVTNVSLAVSIQGGPEGAVFVPPGSQPIPDYTYVAICEYAAGEIALYPVDANGDPIRAQRLSFMTGLSGAEGATIDPITGDFVFSTYGGGNQVISIQGFGVCGAFEVYGQGIPGTNGVPMIIGGGCAGRGQQADVTISNGLPGALGALNVGFRQLSVPILNGFILTSVTNAFFHTLDGTGSFVFPALLPTNPSLSGTSAYFQAGYFDSGAQFGISATAGLKMTMR